MPAELNHTIVCVRDAAASSTFLSEMLGLAPPVPWGPFQVVHLSNGVSLDFMTDGSTRTDVRHLAFLVTEPEFDAVFGRIQERGLEHWADPEKALPGQINHHDGGRGVYWDDPDGIVLEVLTVPHGGGPAAAG